MALFSETLGRGTAIKLAEEGTHVVVIDFNLDAAQKVADEIALTGA